MSEKKPKRSQWAKKFEDKYGYPITNLRRVKQDFPTVDVDTILAKGRGAYASSGSRPNVSSHAWAYARLASALMGGKASVVDKKELGK